MMISSGIVGNNFLELDPQVYLPCLHDLCVTSAAQTAEPCG